MSRFNKRAIGAYAELKTENLAGGEAYTQTPELELVSLLLTSFAKDEFYRTGNETFERLKHLILTIPDKSFVAKAAIYARTAYGMRSITHVCAGELAKFASGEHWAKRFYERIVHRPDDMLEITGYITGKNKAQKIPNAVKKGFALAFNKFDAYTLAKYKGEGKEYKLIDVVNLVHPKPVERNREALEKLVKGDLKSFDTWEANLTKAGQAATSEEEKIENKREVWESLIASKKIGYFALLRNLRNIIEQAPAAVPGACQLLMDANLIRKSLVLPFRYVTAFDEISKMPSSKEMRLVQAAIIGAADISLANVPKLPGDWLVVLDTSTSMKTAQVEGTGALFAAVLAKANNADFITFDYNARYINLTHADSVITISKSIPFTGGDTNFRDIFRVANKKYDRIVILSDMQGWVGYRTPAAEFRTWKKTYNADPFVYSFDLKNYGTMQLPEPKVFALAGWSEKIFDTMAFMETDKNSLVETIKTLEL